MKVLFYCTKNKPVLVNLLNGTDYRLDTKDLWKEYNPNDVYEVLNGKIVAECEVEVEKITLLQKEIFYTPTLNTKELLEKSCLTKEQLDKYLSKKDGYALHIKNLKAFDKPRILHDSLLIDKAPQNMQWVCDIDFNTYILISVRPEWLCKILNSEKTVEVRKKIVKVMLPDE